MKGGGFICPPISDDVLLPHGAWKAFPCCAVRGNSCLLSLSAPVSVEPVSWTDLERVHSKQHLDELRTNRNKLFSTFEIEDGISEKEKVTADDTRFILDASRVSAGAIVEGAKRAFVNKSIVIVPGCGTHHASYNVAEGAGLFADVPLAWLMLREHVGSDIKAVYIDVDVHHANGFARLVDQLKMHDHFYMLDMFNEEIWPCHKLEETIGHVTIPVPYQCGIGNKKFLGLLTEALKRIPRVDMVFYMCSNDTMAGDPLGKCNVTDRAIYQRDAMVVDWARSRGLPIAVMPSRGYGPSSCRVARESMAKLNDKYNIF
jgi:acetoin utilization deacetylase AcuC-like enzyme